MMERLPVLFAGHGSPMNAIENNSFTAVWHSLGQQMPRPRAILSISAHWYVPGSRVNDDPSPRTIYDMYGFPPELYAKTYPAAGSPALAARVQELLGSAVQTDNTWGIDHGSWSVLTHMYPAADIPVVQLSVDRTASPRRQYELGQALRPLRDEGVLILGSGNVVHNLAHVRWDMQGGYPLAQQFDDTIKEAVLRGDIDKVLQYDRLGEAAALAVPMPDHYAPLLYTLGACTGGEQVTVFNPVCVMGSLSMTGYLFEGGGTEQ